MARLKEMNEEKLTAVSQERYMQLEELERAITELEAEQLESIWKPEAQEPQLKKLIKKMFKDMQREGKSHDEFMTNLLLPDKLVNEYKTQQNAMLEKMFTEGIIDDMLESGEKTNTYSKQEADLLSIRRQSCYDSVVGSPTRFRNSQYGSPNPRDSQIMSPSFIPKVGSPIPEALSPYLSQRSSKKTSMKMPSTQKRVSIKM